MNDEQTLLEGYLKQAASKFRNRGLNGHKKVLRCNICGDSKSQPGATSAAILLSGDRWVYKCQRSGCEFNNAKLAVRWLGKTDKWLYERYQEECRRMGYGDERSQRILENLQKQREESERLAAERKAQNEILDQAEFKQLRPIKPKDKEILDYLAKRLIKPTDYPFMTTDNVTNRFHRSIVFPVKESGEIVYWQARKLYPDDGPKYLNKRNGKRGHIFITPCLDASKPVIVCEGPFSALSVENSVCTFGVQYTDEQYVKIKQLPKPVFCYDNDTKGDNAGLEKMNALLKLGHCVIIWSDFLNKMKLDKDTKDMNDVMVAIGRKVTWEDLEDCVSDNYYDMQSSMW